MLEDMFMHQLMQKENLHNIFDVLKKMLFRGKQGKNEVEKKDFTWPSYKISCKTNTL